MSYVSALFAFPLAGMCMNMGAVFSRNCNKDTKYILLREMHYTVHVYEKNLLEILTFTSELAWNDHKLYIGKK